MLAFTQIAVFVVSALGLTVSVAAAPVETTSDLAARAPHNFRQPGVCRNSPIILAPRLHSLIYETSTIDNPSAGTGSCGWQNQDYEWVAAVGTTLFQEMMVDGNPNHSQACGKTANVSWGGKTIKVGIVDRCGACGYNDIDLSPSAFQQFSGLGTGKLQGVSWKFN